MGMACFLVTFAVAASLGANGASAADAGKQSNFVLLTSQVFAWREDF
jgi:hypothetical protein